MGLTSSLFSGISGLASTGNAMQVVGDNIANVNTIGFKSGAVTFQDLLTQNMNTASGLSQVGRGASIGGISSTFTQGSFENTGNSTDLSIGGEGFFIVKNIDTEETYYTRAGDFTFNNDGYLMSSQGLITQGWEMDETGSDVGAIKDIKLTSFSSPPEKTSKITMITNLDSKSLSKSPVLASKWDSSETTPMAKDYYQYQSIIKVYDSLGSTHDVTMYYDKKSGSTWEYLVTCNPNEDLRNLVGETDSTGILAKGTISFGESSGKISNITMETFTGRIGGISVDGALTKEDVRFIIDDTVAFDKGDGYGFKLEYDGTNWSFPTDVNKPFNYRNASIMARSGSQRTSDEKVLLDLDNDGKLDMTVKLSKAAQASDVINFDINSKEKLHVRDIDNMTYTGDALGDNTTMLIDNPDALTQDLKNVKIEYRNNHVPEPTFGPVYDGTNGAWVSRPIATELNPSVVAQDSITPSAPYILNYTKDVSGTISWSWGNSPKTFTYAGGVTASNTTMKINNPDKLTDDTTAPNPDESLVLAYTSATGTWAVNRTGAEVTYPNAAIISGDASGVQLDLDGDATTDITYAFASALTADGTMQFEIAPHDPTVDGYTTADIMKQLDNKVNIDLNDDESADLQFDFSSLKSNSASFAFEIDPSQSASWKMIKPPLITEEYSAGIKSGSLTINDPEKLGNLEKDSTKPYQLIYSSDKTQNFVYDSGVTKANTTKTINDATALTDNTVNAGEPIKLTYTSATTSWAVNRTGAEDSYPNATILSGDATQVQLDLNNDLAADITYTFGSALTQDGSIQFETATWAFNTTDTTNYSSPKADGYPSQSFITSSGTEVSIDFTGDSIADITYDFDSATDQSTIDFEIKNLYVGAGNRMKGDQDKVAINLDGDSNDEEDLSFSFTNALDADSTIEFDMVGTTAWEAQSKTKDMSTSGYFQFVGDFIGSKDEDTTSKIQFDIGSVYNPEKATFVNDSLTTTQYSRSSTTTYQSADGYGAGDLQSIDVSSDGEMTGIYSNGQIVSLFRVALAKFRDNQGLYKEGRNLFRETRESGSALYSKPGTNGLGTIAPNSLEQSNVDIANEFVKMITNQRGFQANSKIITTVDSMLTEAINMKR
ncbi:MAG: flagellar hook-basal body complex protein [Desulfobacterales bacterium]|nr:flagellar hook-basal body complex protein [Desulfobacterales bacterium]